MPFPLFSPMLLPIFMDFAFCKKKILTYMLFFVNTNRSIFSHIYQNIEAYYLLAVQRKHLPLLYPISRTNVSLILLFKSLIFLYALTSICEIIFSSIPTGISLEILFRYLSKISLTRKHKNSFLS